MAQNGNIRVELVAQRHDLLLWTDVADKDGRRQTPALGEIEKRFATLYQ